ncbi:MAG: transposase [Anaerolineae bacterium]|nr:transposase [Anaerolineae bacterium]
MPYARQDLITWQPGGYYHLYNRGARGLNIFRQPENYLFALRRIKHYSRAFHLTIIAYCLMPNHYHLLVRQEGETPAGLLPQRVFNSYTKAYNKRYGHSGTLFEHRYRAKQVSDETYLIHLCRYIHANPVKDRLVADPRAWPYSNYLEWIGERDGTLVDRAFVRAWAGSPQDYQALVWDYLEKRRLPDGAQQFLEALVK